MKKNKNPQASILVSTVIVLSVIMVTFLNFLFISHVERQSATSSNDSLVAYQIADTGVEATLQKITSAVTANPNDQFIASSWNMATSACNTTTGLITVDSGAGKYIVELHYRRINPSATPVVSEDIVSCANNSNNYKFSEILKIKVVGMLTGKASRAVDAFVPIVN